MMKMTMTIAALMAAAPAMAQEPVKLWGNISAGMTEAEVKALYKFPKQGLIGPDSYRFEIDITDKRDATVEPKYERIAKVDRVRKVKLEGTNCSATVRDGLIAKYGEPVSSDDTTKATNRVQARFGTGDQEIVERWINTGVEIKLVRKPTHMDVWEIHYSPVAVVNASAL